jgi:hypothetical protein
MTARGLDRLRHAENPTTCPDCVRTELSASCEHEPRPRPLTGADEPGLGTAQPLVDQEGCRSARPSDNGRREAHNPKVVGRNPSASPDNVSRRITGILRRTGSDFGAVRTQPRGAPVSGRQSGGLRVILGPVAASTGGRAGFVRCFKMFWAREEVDWSPGAGKRQPVPTARAVRKRSNRSSPCATSAPREHLRVLRRPRSIVGPARARSRHREPAAHTRETSLEVVGQALLVRIPASTHGLRARRRAPSGSSPAAAPREF